MGNITEIEQSAGPVNGLGGEYHNYYIYDDLNRLNKVYCQQPGLFDYDFNITMSPTGRIGEKNLTYAAGAISSLQLIGYDDSFKTHQPRVIYDQIRGSQSLFWDANGNLSQMVDCKTGSASINFWDEENRLRLAVNPKFAGYYGYDANGERVYKLTGSTQYDDLNGSNPSFGIIIDGITLYPSPYIVLTKKQYTKHYYIGSEKIATMIGDGGILLKTNHLSNEQRSLIKDGFCRTFEPTAFQYEKTMNMDIQGMSQSKIEYECGYIDRVDLSINSFTPMLEQMMHIWQNSNECKNEIYYTHGDHLGSANWITDADGKPVQYIHYAPYGEQIANKTPYGYDERFKFTGKERDWETGYDYFGARFYDHRKGIWNSVDPLADKYPNVTPYLYCNGNPIMLVDPDGRSTKDVIIGYSLGILTSLIPGTSFLRDTYTPNSSVDYNTALATVDKVSLIVGSEMAIAGASGVGAGSAIVVSGGAAASTIIGAPEGAAIAVGGVAVITGSEALAAGGTMIMANAVSNKAQGYNRGSSKTSTSSAPKSINQLNQDVKKGKAPKGITDFHTGKVVGEQEHVHFKDGSALNKDGTWKHGDGKKSLTIEQAQYLKQNGWNIE